MLSALRLSNVLKKLQSNDLVKFLIQRAAAAAQESTYREGKNTVTSNAQKRYHTPTDGNLCVHSHICPVAPFDEQLRGEVSTITATTAAISSKSKSSADGLQLLSDFEMSASKSGVSNIVNNTADPAQQCDIEKKPCACNETNGATSSTSGKSCLKCTPANYLKFLGLVGTLKHTKRTGWVLRDVNDCESISGHMFRMAVMTFLLDEKEGLDAILCMQLALVHDLAECIVGDITPYCGISKEEKKAREFEAMKDICKLIEPRGERIMRLFEEYEANESPESKFVKDLDRLDMVLQAFEYEKRDDCVMKHQEFFDSTDGKFEHPLVVKLVDEINTQRKSLAEEKGITSVQNGYHKDEYQDQKASTS